MENNKDLSKELTEKLLSGEITMEEVNEQLQNVLASDGLDNFTKLKISFVNDSNNPDPEYAKEGDSGFDLRAMLDEPITLGSLERAIIPTGLKFELPIGIEGEVRSRSGMSSKYGISVLNSPGTVDSNYRGEIKVILVNLSKDEYTITHGDRIAQMVLNPVLVSSVVNLSKVDVLDENTERGSSGFGSTGYK